MFQRKFCLQSANFKRKFQTILEFCLGKAIETNSPSTEKVYRTSGIKLAWYQTQTFGNQQWLWFHICFIITLYYKMWQILIQNAIAILLQIATKVYYKMRLYFQKIRLLLRNASVHGSIMSLRAFSKIQLNIFLGYFNQSRQIG